MNPLSLIPTPDSIPAHWGWFHVFLLGTTVLHFLAMNTMLGTGIIALASSLAGRNRNFKTIETIGSKLPFTLAFTINMGVAPLLFIQVLYGHFFYTSSVLMGVYWLSIICILLIAYYCTYIYDFKFDAIGSARIFLLAAGVLLLLFIGFLFSNNLTLMLTPEKWIQYFSDRSGTIINLSEPTLIPRYLHFAFASIAIGGLSLALWGTYTGLTFTKEGKRTIKQGMKWFTFATLAQIPIGVWFFISLPENVTALFMGKDVFATALFTIGLIGAVAALVFGFRNAIRSCTAAAVFTVVVMTIMRDLVRRAYLKPYFSISSLKVEPQYTPLILFLAALIAGLFTVAYMIRLMLKNRSAPRNPEETRS